VSASKTVSMAQLTEGFVGQIKAQLLQAQTDALREGEESMRAGFQAGEEVALMKIDTMTTPTGYHRAQTGTGVAGRIDTGIMRATFESQVQSSGTERVSGKLGWLDGNAEMNGKEDGRYIALQEYGFESRGREVAPTHALVDGNLVAQQVFEQEFRKRIGALFT
jgi:hypothetical protein